MFLTPDMVLQALVSLPRKSLSANGEKLDLAYITPQLIVSSMPTTSYWASWYRTSGANLKTYLDGTHGSNWHIWNLQEPKENEYSDEFFDSKVSRHPMPDHTPPSLEVLIKIVAEIETFLAESENNVALVHCKAGMGRSGTVACAYLQLYRDLNHDAALAVFTEARMRSFFGNGVSIASQVRYLRYVEKYKKDQLMLPESIGSARRVKIVALSLRNPKYNDITIDVESSVKQHHANLAAHQWDQTVKTHGELNVLQYTPIGPSLHSPIDVVLKFSRTTAIKGVPVVHSKAKVFFNATMESRESHIQQSPISPVTTYCFSCPWSQFDGIKGTWIRGTALFESLEVSYEIIEGEADTIQSQVADTAAAEDREAFSPEISVFDATKLPYPEEVLQHEILPETSK